jgi:hypothetical protein
VHVVFHGPPWHCAHESATVPPTPSSAAPWHVPQLARFWFAEYAWNPLLVWSIQSAEWPPAIRVPHGWHVTHAIPDVTYASWFDGLVAAAPTFCTWTAPAPALAGFAAGAGAAAGCRCEPHPAAETNSDVIRQTAMLRVRST